MDGSSRRASKLPRVCARTVACITVALCQADVTNVRFATLIDGRWGESRLLAGTPAYWPFMISGQATASAFLRLANHVKGLRKKYVGGHADVEFAWSMLGVYVAVQRLLASWTSSSEHSVACDEHTADKDNAQVRADVHVVEPCWNSVRQVRAQVARQSHIVSHNVTYTLCDCVFVNQHAAA